MRLILPFLLLILPLAEIAGFVVVGGHIGALATIALVVATTLLGGVLLRTQGLGALVSIRNALEAGTSPGRELVHGLMIMVAGMLLLLPGFITDLIGLLLFLSPVRDAMWRAVGRHVIVVGSGGRSWPTRRPRSGTIDLDADQYSRDDPEQRKRIDTSDVR